MAPTILLTQPTIIWQGAIHKTVGDASSRIILPLNITLYNTTTNNLTVASNGVSLLSLSHLEEKTLLKIQE
jgi:hypothetical protein